MPHEEHLTNQESSSHKANVRRSVTKHQISVFIHLSGVIWKKKNSVTVFLFKNV